VTDQGEVVDVTSSDYVGGGYPFDGDPFGAAPVSEQDAPQFGPPSGAPPPPSGEVSTLATLSVVFAFVFAPVGVVLGHLALSQIKARPQPGHRRAILGLTLSYALLALALVALIVWLLVGAARHGGDTGIAEASAPPPMPSVQSTVVTPPAQGRRKVNVAELRVGDCVEIQKNQPDPSKPAADDVYIYRARCEVRDGVFQVSRKVGNAQQCPPGEYLANNEETIIACFVKYGQP
jgi:hypothetical protein